jgi:hypothetical protein
VQLEDVKVVVAASIDSGEVVDPLSILVAVRDDVLVRVMHKAKGKMLHSALHEDCTLNQLAR